MNNAMKLIGLTEEDLRKSMAGAKGINEVVEGVALAALRALVAEIEKHGYYETLFPADKFIVNATFWRNFCGALEEAKP